MSEGQVFFKHLHGPYSPFPVDTVAITSEAKEAITTSRGYRFGVSAEEVIQTLRKLADDIESKAVSLQSISRKTERNLEDFEFTVLSVTYSEPR